MRCRILWGLERAKDCVYIYVDVDVDVDVDEVVVEKSVKSGVAFTPDGRDEAWR
jgi:hypothetical protein